MNRILILALSILIVAGCSAPAPQTQTIPEANPEKIVSTDQADESIAPKPIATNLHENTNPERTDLTKLWSYGLTSIRTGEPLISSGGQHNLNPDVIDFGHNQVVDKNGKVIIPRGAPLAGGEQLVNTAEYQEDHNTREFARIYTIMAPIRDTILYHFEETSLEDWLAITEILTLNNIKITAAAEINGRSILSTRQVYDYVASGTAEGSPVMRYLEEAELELKCLAFIDFNFTNPEGHNHCEDHHLEIGSGISLP